MTNFYTIHMTVYNRYILYFIHHRTVARLESYIANVAVFKTEWLK